VLENVPSEKSSCNWIHFFKSGWWSGVVGNSQIWLFICGSFFVRIHAPVTGEQNFLKCVSLYIGLRISLQIIFNTLIIALLLKARFLLPIISPALYCWGPGSITGQHKRNFWCKSAKRKRVSPCSSVLSCHFHAATAPLSFILPSPTFYNLRNWQRC
jgi:hypothetical protein